MKPSKRQLALNSSLGLRPTSPLKTPPRARKRKAMTPRDISGNVLRETSSEGVKEKCKEIIFMSVGKLTGEQSGIESHKENHIINPDEDECIDKNPAITAEARAENSENILQCSPEDPPKTNSVQNALQCPHIQGDQNIVLSTFISLHFSKQWSTTRCNIW